MKDFHNATGYWAGAGSVKRQLHDKVSEIRVSVRDFMAGPPNGSTDNWESFMDAADFLLGKGGGILEIPAVPNLSSPYVLSQAFKPMNCPNAVDQRGIIIQGSSGREVTGAYIVANHRGGVIENHYPKYTLRQVRNIRGVNYHLAGSGLLWNLAQGGIIEQCEFGASLFGVQLPTETYNTMIRNCIIHGSGNNGIGIYCAQASVENTSLVGWDVGLRCFNFGFGMRNMRFEVDKTACQIGMDYRCAFLGKKNGANLEITEILDGSLLMDTTGAADVVAGHYLIGGWAIRSDHPSGMPWITGQVSGTSGGPGIYTLSNQAPMNVSPQRFMAGKATQIGAVTGSDIQTERCDVGIEVMSAVSINLTSCGVSGTVGCGRGGITSTTWALNVATVNLNHEHCLETGRRIMLEGNSVAAYNTWPSGALITKVDADTFTFPLVLGADPGTGSGGEYSPPVQHGYRIRGATSAVFSAISAGNYEQAGMDLYYDGNTNQYSCSMLGLFTTGTIIPPPGNMKANWHWPLVSNLSRISLLFLNLPGKSASTIGPSVGMQYVITDAVSTAIGAAVTAGSSTHTYLVAYTEAATWVRVA